MSAALTAFFLLVIICAFGVWIINRGQSGIAEAFITKEEATKRCEDELKQCNENVANCVPSKPCEFSSAKCKDNKDACDAIVKSAFTKPADKKVVSDYTGLAASALDEKTPPSDLEKLLIKVKQDAMRSKIEADNTGLAASAREKQITSAEFEKLINKIGDMAIGRKPTDEELKKAAAGAGIVPETNEMEKLYASYIGLPRRIKPHEDLPEDLPIMTASSSTDKGTGAESILKNEKKMSSIRQMIRDEIASAVRDELAGSRLFNQYQINYSSQ